MKGITGMGISNHQPKKTELENRKTQASEICLVLNLHSGLISKLNFLFCFLENQSFETEQIN